jgi:hypothetical protein
MLNKTLFLMIGGSGPMTFQPQVDDILLCPLKEDVSQEHSLDDNPWLSSG